MPPLNAILLVALNGDDLGRVEDSSAEEMDASLISNYCFPRLFLASSIKTSEMYSHLHRVLTGELKEEQAKKKENQSFSARCISEAARLKGTQGCKSSGVAICLGDESSSKPDTGSRRRRVAVFSPLKTKHTQTHTC